MKDLAHLEISEYFQILWKRRWYFLVVAVVVISGVMIYALQLRNIYKSEARIMIAEPLVSEDYVRPTVRNTPEDKISSIREQLTSRTFLQTMIETNRLFGIDNPKFVMEDTIASVQKQIGIEKTSSNTFAISFLSTDPQFAQDFTRKLTLEVINNSAQAKRAKVNATDQFIDEQLANITNELKAKGKKIEDFKVSHLGELPEQASANMSAISGLHSQLNAVENAMQQAQERSKNIEFRVQEHRRMNLLSQSLAAVDATIKPVAGNRGPSSAEVDLAKLKNQLALFRTKYTENYPDVLMIKKEISRLEQQIQNQKSAVATEMTPIGEAAAEKGKKEKAAVDQIDPMEAAFQFEESNIKSEIAKRQKEKDEILQQIKIYQNRLKLAPMLEQELVTHLREESVLKAQFDNLQKQKFSTKMAKTVEEGDKNATYKVIDEANLPGKPENLNRLQLILMGIGGGFVVGLGAAFGRELMDTTIASEEEAKKLLDLPVLVTIPVVPKEKKNKNLKIA